jgi:hypothetical protein
MTVSETLAYLEPLPYLTVKLYRNGNPLLLAASEETSDGRWRLDWLEEQRELNPTAPWRLGTGVFEANEYFADVVT